jgi:hypothetical protein
VGLWLRAGTLHVRLPAIPEPPSQYRYAGRLRSAGGPVTVTVRADPATWLQIARVTAVDAVAATPVPWTERVVARKRACRRYVDWLAP